MIQPLVQPICWLLAERISNGYMLLTVEFIHGPFTPLLPRKIEWRNNVEASHGIHQIRKGCGVEVRAIQRIPYSNPIFNDTDPKFAAHVIMSLALQL